MKIVIQTNADFTPKGKRSARIVKTAKNGKKIKATIAWYVGSELFRYLELSNDNIAMTAKWRAA